MSAVQSLNIAVRFLLELAALAALGNWGFHSGNGIIMKWVLAAAAPLAAAVIWGTLGSPGAPYPVKGIYRTMLELLIIAAASSGLFFTKSYGTAGVYTSAALINLLLMHVWKQ